MDIYQRKSPGEKCLKSLRITRIFDKKYVSLYTLIITLISIMGKFVITLRKNGEFQFNLKATNGQVILTSEGYNTKAACLNGVESVKKNAIIPERFEVKVAKNGKPFFNLKASNGQVIGASQMYSSEATMKNGIASVAKNAPEAPVVEEL